MNTIQKIVVNHFNLLASKYDYYSLKRKKYIDKINEIVCDKISQFSNPNVIDIGCGTGSRAEKIKEITNCNMTCCDISEKMLEIASRKKIDKVFQADILEVSDKVEDNKYDVVLCLFNVFGYLSCDEDRSKAMRELASILDNKGMLIIDVMNLFHTGEGLSFKKNICQIACEMLISAFSNDKKVGDIEFNVEVEHKFIAGWVHGFSDRKMKQLFKKAGLKVIEKRIIGYDSGEEKKLFWKGQLFYVCSKK